MSLAVEPEDLAPAQGAPGGQRHGSPVLLGHGLGQRSHLVDVGDPAVRHPVGPTALDPAGVLHEEVVEDGGVEDGLQQPVGGPGGAGSLGCDLGVPGADVERA